MTVHVRWRLAALVCVLGTLASACTSGSSGPGGATGPDAATTAPTSAGSGAVAQQWWHDGDDYCTILRATLRAGGANGTPGDALAATTTTLLDALQRSAPSAVQSSWSTYAPALEALAKSDGDPKQLATIDRTAVAAAAKAIAADAKSRCHLDLSA